MSNIETLFGKEKIVVKGLELRPITMEHYGEWLKAYPVLTLRMSTLPVKYATMPYANAIFALEADSFMKGDKLGFLSQFCMLICLSCGIDLETSDNAIEIIIDRDDFSRLKSIVVHIGSEDNTIELSPFDLTQVRNAIAELNGAELPNENENPELIEALQAKEEMQGIVLDTKPIDCIDAVACASGLRAKDLATWTIREFEIRKDTIDRAKRFTVNAIAESNGCSWKGGNPTPSWIFNRVKTDSGFTPVSSLMGKLGSSEAWLESQMEEKSNTQH